MKFKTLLALLVILPASVFASDTFTPRIGLDNPALFSPNWGPKIWANNGIIDAQGAWLNLYNIYTASNVYTARIYARGGITSTGTITASNFVGLASTSSYATNAGNASTVTNGVYTTGSYSNPTWLTGLAGTKISGAVPLASSSTYATNAGTATNGVVTTGSYVNPAWITSLAGSKVKGSITSTGSVTSPSFVGQGPGDSSFDLYTNTFGTPGLHMLSHLGRGQIEVRNNAGSNTIMLSGQTGTVSANIVHASTYQTTGATGAGYVMTDTAGDGNLSMQPATGGGLTIGAPINSGSPYYVLYESSSNKLAQSTDFAYYPVTREFVAPNMVVGDIGHADIILFSSPSLFQMTDPTDNLTVELDGQTGLITATGGLDTSTITATSLSLGSPALNLSTTSIAAGSTTGTSITVSVTVPAGANRLLTAYVGDTSGFGTVTVTYGGVALTQAVEGLTGVSRLYYLTAPAVGTANLVVSGLIANVSSSALAAVVWKNANQLSPFGTILNPDTIFGLTFPQTVTTPDGSIVFDFQSGVSSTPNSPGAGQQVVLSTPTVTPLYTSSLKVRTGATTTMTWVDDGGNPDYIAAPVRVAPGGEAVTGTLTVYGTAIFKSPDGSCSQCGPSNSDVWACSSVTCP